MRDTRIVFNNESALAQFLLRLAQWGVRDSQWYLGTDDRSVVTRNANVIDVCTETFKPSAFTIEKLTKCRTCPRGIIDHSMRNLYPDLCFKCADNLAQHMNDIRP